MKDRKKLFERRLTRFADKYIFPEFDQLFSRYGMVRRVEASDKTEDIAVKLDFIRSVVDPMEEWMRGGGEDS